jgi:hypothetical protein
MHAADMEHVLSSMLEEVDVKHLGFVIRRVNMEFPSSMISAANVEHIGSVLVKVYS